MLSLFAAIINKLREKVQNEVPRIFEAVFECTLMMITKNFEVRSHALPHTQTAWNLPALRCAQQNNVQSLPHPLRCLLPDM